MSEGRLHGTSCNKRRNSMLLTYRVLPTNAKHQDQQDGQKLPHEPRVSLDGELSSWYGQCVFFQS